MNHQVVRTSLYFVWPQSGSSHDSENYNIGTAMGPSAPRGLYEYCSTAHAVAGDCFP